MSEVTTPSALPCALIVGLGAEAERFVREILTQVEIKTAAHNLEALTNSALEPAPFVILTGDPPECVSQAEVAQSLRMMYPKTALFFVTQIRSGFERKVFLKNGLTDAFLLPVDSDTLKNSLLDLVSSQAGSKVAAYQPVKMIDMAAGVVMDFDTFFHMPANNKYIRFNGAGDPIDHERVQRLKQKQVNNLHVMRKDIQKFYNFTAAQLKAIGSSQTMSETERREKMQTAVRSLLLDLYNDSTHDASTTHGRALMTNCQQIVKAYISQGEGTQSGWHQKIVNAMAAGSSNYSHSTNVATFAALFSLGLGVGKPEDLAIAGILHDIGLADVPGDFQSKSKSEWTDQNREAYRTHVQKTQDMIRDRKLILSDVVIKIIDQHHERCDGLGYPKGLPASRIIPEAKLFAIADEMDEQAALRQDEVGFNPFKVILFLHEQASVNPSASRFDFELLKKLVRLFAPTQTDLLQQAS